jgi:predicted Zn-dependent peptidase
MHLRLAFLLLCLAGTASAMTRPEDVKTFTLKNGMKVLVLEDRSIPNANLYLYWKVGSRNEGPGITGLSHFLEHMMFNGAEKYGPKEFDRVMEAEGGSNNAWTSQDVTAYTNWFPAAALETIFELEADRIGSLAFDDKMIESERGVVLSEWTTSRENSNWSLLAEQVGGAAFTAHPYRWPVLGFESDIRNWTKSDLKAYFRKGYAPNNAVLVLVGDIDPARVRALAEKHLEPIPRRDPPRPVHTVEPAQRGEKRVRVHKDVSTPNLMIAYHAPRARSPDYHAVDLLASVLGEGRSSRLHRALVDGKQLAVEAEVYFSMTLDPELLTVWAVCAPGVSEETLLAGIDEELARISRDGVLARERDRAVKRRTVEFYRDLETINGKAGLLGTYEIYHGDYRKLFDAPARIGAVTSADLERVARSILKRSNRTVGVLKKAEVD